MLNIPGMYNVWFCIVYVILHYMFSSIGNKYVRHNYEKVFGKYVQSVLKYTLHSWHEEISSLPTSYLVRYCHECGCVFDIHVWLTNGIWNVTACSGVYLFQCFVLMWCRQQVPAEYMFEMWCHTCRKQISFFGETEESF